MALFEPHDSRETEEIIGSDAATRALSVTAVENDFVAGVYEKLASVYDFTFGPVLHPGRVNAIERMGIRADDRVLEAVSDALAEADFIEDPLAFKVQLDASVADDAEGDRE